MQNSKNFKKNSSNSKFYLIPIILSISLVPLIVRLTSFYPKTYDFPWFPKDERYDLFLYHKSIFFNLICILSFIFLIYSLFSHSHTFKKGFIFITLGGLGLLALLSSIFSPWREVAFSGLLESFESIWVLLGYLFISFYSYQYISKQEDIKYLFKWIMISMVVISLIGMSQILSHDIYLTSAIRDFIIPGNLKNIGELKAYSGLSQVHLSLFNPNYVGSYTALMIPVLFGGTMIIKKPYIKIASGIMSVLLFIYLLASQSRGGFFALIISFIFLLILQRKKIFKNWKILIAVLTVCIASFLIINYMTDNILLTRLKNSFSFAEKNHIVTELETNNDNVSLIYNNQNIYIKFSHNKQTEEIHLSIYDSENNLLPLIASEKDGYYRINNANYKNLLVKPVSINDGYGFAINLEDNIWTFTNDTEDGTFYYLNLYKNLDKMVTPESVDIFKNESFASSRGYIWNRTIPLLKDHIILGSGADTFVYVFPNNDYIGKYNAGLYENMLTRPHNMYLQIGVQYGVLALILFIIFYLYYFLQSIKLYFKNTYNTLLEQTGIILFISTLGYMIAGFVNDSSISSAPVFWVFIGAGLSVNNLVKTSKDTIK